MRLREYAPEDLKQILKLFYDTVADLAPGGYFNRLYIHRDFQRMGIASELCLALENRARMQGIKELTVHASITARPFFEKRGYKLLREQRVIRRETELTNYVMHIFL